MKNTLKITLIALILFGLGVFRLYNHIQENGYGLFYLLTAGKEDNLVFTKQDELLAGDIILGKFFLPQPNLGTVSVRFSNHNRDSHDTLIFRIKEKDTSNWLYVAKYNTDQFRAGALFPFGFPVIRDSANKNYVFELESDHGATGSGIFLDRQEPSFTAISFFDRQELFQNPHTTTSFLVKKFLNIFTTSDDIFLGIVYFSPLILYLLYLLSALTSYQFLPSIVLLCIGFDIFCLKESHDYFLISVGILWLLAVLRFKFDSSLTGLGALFFLIVTPFLGLSGLTGLAEKTATWSFLFLTIAIFQQIYEFKHNTRQFFSLSKFISNGGDFSVSTPIVKKVFYLLLLFTTSFYFYNILVRVRHGLELFKEFFPELSTNPTAIWYFVIVVGLILLTSLFIIGYFKLFFDHKLLFVLIVICLYQAVSQITAKMTTFEHVPKIFSISPSTTAEAWTDVTITGRNFQDLPFVGKIYLNGVEQGEYMISWSDQKVVFRTSPRLSRSGTLCLQTMSKGRTNCQMFEYLFDQKQK